MAELADALDSGSSEQYRSCKFKSCYPHRDNPREFSFRRLPGVLFSWKSSAQKIAARPPPVAGPPPDELSAQKITARPPPGDSSAQESFG